MAISLSQKSAQPTPLHVSGFVTFGDVAYQRNSDQTLLEGENMIADTEWILPSPEWCTNNYPGLLGDPILPFMLLHWQSHYETPDAWVGQQFHVSGEFHPNFLHFQYTKVDGLEEELGLVDIEARIFRTRDNAIQPCAIREVPELGPTLVTCPDVSFAGPIDRNSYKLKCDPDMGLTNDQLRCCAFVRIATRLTPHRGSTAPPGEGFHIAHVLLFLPVTQKQNASLVKLLLDMPKNSYESHGRWVAVAGYMIGILNKDCLAQLPNDLDTTVDIPVVVAKDIKWLTTNLLDNRGPGAPVVAPPTPGFKVTTHHYTFGDMEWIWMMTKITAVIWVPIR